MHTASAGQLWLSLLEKSGSAARLLLQATAGAAAQFSLALLLPALLALHPPAAAQLLKDSLAACKAHLWHNGAVHLQQTNSDKHPTAQQRQLPSQSDRFYTLGRKLLGTNCCHTCNTVQRTTRAPVPCPVSSRKGGSNKCSSSAHLLQLGQNVLHQLLLCCLNIGLRWLHVHRNERLG